MTKNGVLQRIKRKNSLFLFIFMHTPAVFVSIQKKKRLLHEKIGKQEPRLTSVPKKFHRVGTVVPTQWYKNSNTPKREYHCGGTPVELHRQKGTSTQSAGTRHRTSAILPHRTSRVSAVPRPADAPGRGVSSRRTCRPSK